MKKHEAIAAAEALAKKLGPMWIPHIWENLGWNYCVRTLDGRMNIHQNGSSYTAFLHHEIDSTGGVVAETAKSPRAAIELCLKAANDQLAAYTVMVGVVASVLGAFDCPKQSRWANRQGTSKRKTR